MSLPEHQDARQGPGETIRRRRTFAMIPDALVADDRLSSHAVRVWARLDRYAGRGMALPSRETLAGDLGVSVDVVKRSLAELVRAGWISRERVGASNVWHTVLHDEPLPEATRNVSSGRPPAGARVIRQRSSDDEKRRTSAPIADEKRRTSAPIADEPPPGNGARNGAPVHRPRKEKTRREERTTSSLHGTQLAVVDITDRATPAHLDSASRRPTTTRGTRIPDGWWPDADLIAWCRENTPDVGAADVEEFRDYWTAEAGAKARKLRWDLAWKNRARELQARRRGRPGTGARRSTTDDRVNAALDLARQLAAEEAAHEQLTIGDGR